MRHQTTGRRDGDSTVYTCDQCGYMIIIHDDGPPERVCDGDPGVEHVGSYPRGVSVNAGPGRGQRWRLN